VSGCGGVWLAWCGAGLDSPANGLGRPWKRLGVAWAPRLPARAGGLPAGFLGGRAARPLDRPGNARKPGLRKAAQGFGCRRCGQLAAARWAGSAAGVGGCPVPDRSRHTDIDTIETIRPTQSAPARGRPQPHARNRAAVTVWQGVHR
jgi:hypothetical protein